MTNNFDIILSLGDVQSESPWNFSWVVENQLAAMGWPDTKQNLNFLWQKGIRHLVTLSPEMIPPIKESQLAWTLIPIEEFKPPTLEDIIRFIEVCAERLARNESVGVHCRMGNGRTGVMAACFLVHFYGLAPERAITDLRRHRPGSVETYGQEKAVVKYHDYLRGTMTNHQL